MPLISVIIPVYNSEKYIEQCLNSVLSQSLKDMEIICIDDCSCDSSCSIIKNYQKTDSRISLIQNKENKKQGYCRNLGIQKASSQYIHFLDSDDYITDNDFYKNVIAQMEKKHLEIFIFNFSEYYQDKNWLVTSEKYKRFPFIENDMSGMCWDKIYLKNFLLDHTINFAAGVFWEDILFSFLLKIYASKIEYTDKQYICYRLNSNHSTTTNILKIYPDSIKMTEISFKLLSDRNLLEKNKITFINYYFGILYFDIAHRVFEKSLYHYCKMLVEIQKLLQRLDITETQLQEIKKSHLQIYKHIKNMKEPFLLSEILRAIPKKIFSIRNIKPNKQKIITLLGININIHAGEE